MKDVSQTRPRRGGDAAAATYLGALFEQQGNAGKARELYEEGRRGGDAGAATKLGVLFAKQGDTGKLSYKHV